MTLVDSAKARWRRLQDRHAWLRHVLAAYGLLQRNHGNQYAAAITFFSFLALFPLLLLAVSVLGFVLYAQPGLQRSVFSHITSAIPGGVGKTLHDAIQAAITNRTSVGVIGLVGVLLTGLGWIANLREAIDAVYSRKPAPKNFVMSRVSNLLVLVGLGLGVLVSLGLTVVGTALTDQILHGLGLHSIVGTVLLKVLGIAFAALGNMVVFWWVLVRLPQVHIERGPLIRGLILAAVGFEVLKIIGTFTVAHTANSPTAGPFAGVLAVLIWVQLVSRFMLFCCAWLATAGYDERAAVTLPVTETAVTAGDGRRRTAEAPAVTPATVGATLVGAGAVAGAVAYWAATRQRAPGN